MYPPWLLADGRHSHVGAAPNSAAAGRSCGPLRGGAPSRGGLLCARACALCPARGCRPSPPRRAWQRSPTAAGQAPAKVALRLEILLLVRDLPCRGPFVRPALDVRPALAQEPHDEFVTAEGRHVEGRPAGVARAVDVGLELAEDLDDAPSAVQRRVVQRRVAPGPPRPRLRPGHAQRPRDVLVALQRRVHQRRAAEARGAGVRGRPQRGLEGAEVAVAGGVAKRLAGGGVVAEADERQRARPQARQFLGIVQARELVREQQPLRRRRDAVQSHQAVLHPSDAALGRELHDRDGVPGQAAHLQGDNVVHVVSWATSRAPPPRLRRPCATRALRLVFCPARERGAVVAEGHGALRQLGPPVRGVWPWTRRTSVKPKAMAITWHVPAAHGPRCSAEMA
mmetsp:Transcript_2988/g.8513  ORF Transcript_2988/g.8513 Transcript_2988/m.8513 type:complete len:396 (-) Transcript_2988:8-1195(-)